ncbi:MAG TPA: hypothetical protein DIC56_20940 [Rhizobium sp.]|nr:hypothetical protein [Rhizobium sp.]
MRWQVERVESFIRRISAKASLSFIAAIIVLCTSIWGLTPALADRDNPQRERGACEGAYPGWLRGIVDGYNDLSKSPVENPSNLLLKVPTPAALPKGDARLGFGDGLQEGFKLGVAYGVELGKAARTRDNVSQKMADLTAQFQAYIQTHCVEPAAALNWDTTFMNDRGTSTVSSLNEARLVMHLAANANQMAIQAENLAQEAKEAEAKGDQAVVTALKAGAQSSAQTAANFAQMAKSHAATGREEAVQAIIDAQAAADRAKKAADSIGG